MNDLLSKGTSSDPAFACPVLPGRFVGSLSSTFIDVPVPVGSGVSGQGGAETNDAERFLRQERIRRQIQLLGELEENWDQRGAAAPSERAIRLALRILSHGTQYAILPDAVGPSPDGGLMLEFHVGDKYFLIDIYNDGDIVFLRENECGDTKTTQEREADIDRIIFELWGASNGPVR